MYNLNDLLDYLYKYWRKYYMCPSLREMIANTPWSSTSSVSNALLKLEEDGAIIRSPGASRNIVPVGIVKAIDQYWGLDFPQQ